MTFVRNLNLFASSLTAIDLMRTEPMLLLNNKKYDCDRSCNTSQARKMNVVFFLSTRKIRIEQEKHLRNNNLFT